MGGKLGEHAVHILALPSLETIPLIERFAHSDRREISPSCLVVGKPPTFDECSIATEKAEEKHRLQDVTHDEGAVLVVPGRVRA